MFFVEVLLLLRSGPASRQRCEPKRQRCDHRAAAVQHSFCTYCFDPFVHVRTYCCDLFVHVCECTNSSGCRVEHSHDLHVITRTAFVLHVLLRSVLKSMTSHSRCVVSVLCPSPLGSRLSLRHRRGSESEGGSTVVSRARGGGAREPRNSRSFRMAAFSRRFG